MYGYRSSNHPRYQYIVFSHMQLLLITRLSSPVVVTENRTLELHSPDGVHNCVLRATDAGEAVAWFNTLHSALNVLTLQALQEANRVLGSLLGDLQHIGWLARRPLTELLAISVACYKASTPKQQNRLCFQSPVCYKDVIENNDCGHGHGLAHSYRRGKESEEVKKVVEQTSSQNGGRVGSESSEDLERWQSVFAAVTERELRLYESAPWSPEAWGGPLHTCPLISTRYNTPVTACRKFMLVSSSRQTDMITFSVRCGTPEGVLTHHLRAETHRDLANWARALVQGSHNCAQSQHELVCREYVYRCMYQGQPAQLVLHYENGFTLQEGNIAPGREPRTLWKFPFERLRMSADDGARLLWLDFGGEEGEMELDLESCPKPLVFILHNFLSAKIHRLGLLA
uniref:PH domain-containing protein n=2 Tax=Timema TaxID=61471 RepID=A0A7R9F9H9_9NEOP|nr:unnamed protein product [Timema bartmani]